MEPPDSDQSDRLAVFVKSVSRGASEEQVDATDRQLMHRKLAGGPSGDGLAHVTVRVGTEQIVSSLSLTPKGIWAWGEPAVWGEVGDAMTDASFRRRGLFGQLHESITAAAAQQGVEAIYALPNDQSGPAFVKHGWLTKDNADLLTCRHLCGSARLADAMTARFHDHPLINVAARAIGSPPVDRAVKWARGLVHRRRASEFALGPADGFGPEFDHLWQRVRKQVGFAAIRDREALAWRFERSPLRFDTTVARRGSTLVGYIVTHVQAHEHRAQGTLVIADWLYDPAMGPGVATDLLGAAMSKARSTEIEAVSATTTERSAFSLPWSKFGFRISPHVKPMVLYDNDVGRRAAADAEPWHFTNFDST